MHLIRSTKQHTVLIRLANLHGWLKGAEIGVLRGKTLFAMLDAIPLLKMYAVDQWKQLPLRDDENAETYTDFDMEELKGLVLRKARTYHGRCTVLCGDSAAMSVALSDGELDFVFIDGDHTEQGLERDLRAWAPKVKAAGYIVGHDCHWITVARIINRLCPGWVDHGEAVWAIPRMAVKIQ